jgi:hypothetical protein
VDLLPQIAGLADEAAGRRLVQLLRDALFRDGLERVMQDQEIGSACFNANSKCSSGSSPCDATIAGMAIVSWAPGPTRITG